jgi:hypothetical protein
MNPKKDLADFIVMVREEQSVTIIFSKKASGR